MNKKQKRLLRRILVAFALFVVAIVLEATGLLEVWFGTGALWAEFVLFLIPFLVAGYDVLLKAAKNIGHGQVFDENFLIARVLSRLGPPDVRRRGGDALLSGG